jgi:hypothetical protein
MGNIMGWGGGKGEAMGEMDFRMKLKGNGRSTMDAKTSADGIGNTRNATQYRGTTNAQKKGYRSNYSNGLTQQKNKGSRLPFGSNYPAFGNNPMSQFPFNPNMGFFGNQHNTNAPFPFNPTTGYFANQQNSRSSFPFNATNQAPMRYNRSMYGQTPYTMYQPLPRQNPMMQTPYGNQQYPYPMTIEQQNKQTKNIANMQQHMERERKQYNAFIARMQAQQKAMMAEFSQQ